MKHKKRYFILIVIMAFILLFVGVCNKEPQSELSIEEIVAKHYEQSFEYAKTFSLRYELHYDAPALNRGMTYFGSYRRDPYSESRDLVSNDIAAEDVENTEYKKNPYYTGYGEEVTYTYVGKRLIHIPITNKPFGEGAPNLVWFSMYRAEYPATDDEVLAAVTQEYYIDYEENQIVKIATYWDERDDTDVLVHYLNNLKEPYEVVKAPLQDAKVDPPYSFREEILFYDFR